MATFVYLLCALTSTACAFVLLRNYRRSGARLLLWGGLCFSCFAAGNVVLFIDLGLLPASIDLSFYRDGLTFLGLVFFSYGLIWEAK
ncbi:MAG: DUF5985 family protein [Verrucomicrobiota bacterium]